MDHLLIDQLESLLASNLNSKRIPGQLLILVGSLAGDDMPERISRQMTTLSRIVLLQDLFEALAQPLNNLSRNTQLFKIDKDEALHGACDMTGLLAQIEDARRQLAECEPVNYAELIAWVVGKAKENKLWSNGRSRR